jgi:hypothetical protein
LLISVLESKSLQRTTQALAALPTQLLFVLLLSLLLFATMCFFLLFVTRAFKLLNSLAVIPLNPLCLLILVLESKSLQKTLQAFAALLVLLSMLLALLLFATKRFLILFAMLAYIFLAAS